MVPRSANRDPLAKLTKLGKLTAQGGAHHRAGKSSPFPQACPAQAPRSLGEEGQGVFVNMWAPPLYRNSN